ncbi:MAG: 5-(carboxyamino)imidazole ribonucleotide synthase [Saprospiraceae bacterium]|nr:5-(carboxyamino)imidazole ribonucleotide synthase [Saprospiraceae bacterium]
MKKLGILGGGQLGKMMCLAAADWDLETYVLDTEGASAQPYCKHFVVGNFKNYDDVVNFGRKVDILTIEIEHVNIAALKQLESEGIKVHPKPSALETVTDKGLQKEFFVKNKIPTADFKLFDSKSQLINYLKEINLFSWVWKSRTGGYDGKGVAIIKSLADAEKLPDVPCLLEEKVDFQCEIAVMFARNERGEVTAYAPVLMFFDHKTNMLDMQICPAPLERKQLQFAVDYGRKLIEQLDICGVLAVEMFLLHNPRGKSAILVNEIAPRPHNSGHHTIEAAETSQFQQHIRAVLNLPLGSPAMRSPSVLLNLVGEDGFEGIPKVEGFEKGLNTDGVHFHFYGKKITKPFRKMGHVTIMNRKIDKARAIGNELKEIIKIVA